MGKIVTESSVGDARDHSELRKDAENSSKRDEGEDGRKDCGVLSKRKRAEDELDRVGRDAKRRRMLRTEDSNQVESSEVRLDSNISKEQETNESSACTLIRGNEVKMKTFIPKDRNLQLQKNDDDDDDDGVDSKHDDTKQKSKEVGTEEKEKEAKEEEKEWERFEVTRGSWMIRGQRS